MENLNYMLNNKNELIAITGCGSISPLGTERSAIYSNYLNQDTFLVNKNFNLKTYPVGSLSNISEKKIDKYILENPKLKNIDRTALMAIAAASSAFIEAGWAKNPDKITGVNIGSSRGSTALFEKLHKEFIFDVEKKTSVFTSPLTTLGYISNHVASSLNIIGPVISTSVTCSTGIQAICNAIAWIKSGMASRFIAGGSEAPLTDFTIAQVDALCIYSKNIEGKYPCAPHSISEKRNNTFVLGEGAAAFAIEKINISELKNYKPLGIIESVGFSFERPPTLTGINEDGSLIAASMKMALNNMITTNEVDQIIMHSPGTYKGDEAEMNAINSIFKVERPNLFSNKWKIGHAYSASPALSLELGLICLQNNYSPSFPYKTSFNNHKKNIKKVMINATGFGGNAISIIVSHPDIF